MDIRFDGVEQLVLGPEQPRPVAAGPGAATLLAMLVRHTLLQSFFDMPYCPGVPREVQEAGWRR